MGFIVSSTGLFTGFMIVCGSGGSGSVSSAGVFFGKTTCVDWLWVGGVARAARLGEIMTVSASSSSLDVSSLCDRLGLRFYGRCGMVLGGTSGAGLFVSEGK